MAYCYALLLLPTLQLARAALRRWFTWNCSPSYARITSSLKRLFVAFAGTKHCCLTAINRDGALCCPDFPRDRGLKPLAFLPLSRDRPTRYLFSLVMLLLTLTGVVHATSAFRRRAAYGNRTRLLGLGSRCTTDVLMPQFRCKITTFFSYMQKKRQNTYFSRNEHVYILLFCSRARARLCI